jgi:hypothetical protein
MRQGIILVRSMPFAWRIFVVNAAILVVAAVALAFSPATVSFPIALAEGIDPKIAFELVRVESQFNPRAVSREEMNRLLGGGVDEGLPKSRARRLQRAWVTIGAVPPGTNLREAFKDFGASSIVGFYDTDDQRLVYVGSDAPSPLQRTVLAHEITHALDDQHFNLDLLDDLDAKCRDEAGMAFLSLVEGSAEVISGRWATENLSAAEFADLQAEQGDRGGRPWAGPPLLRQNLKFSCTHRPGVGD